MKRRPFLEALGTAGFLLDVSNLALLFSVVDAALGVAAAVGVGVAGLTPADASGLFIAAVVLAALGLWMRQGSRIALYIALALFALDLMLWLVTGSQSVIGAVGRLFLLVVLVRSFWRNRQY